MQPIRLRCDSIRYRQGFIEVSAGIHTGCINVEAWDIKPDFDISEADVRGEDFPDDSLQANTELELDVETAEQLVAALQLAIHEIKERS